MWAPAGMLVPVDAPSPFGNTLLVTGPESLLAERELGELIKAATAERPDAAVIRLSAVDLTTGGLVEATGGSLFADSSVVIVSDLQELPVEVADTLVAIATSPGPELALAVVHPGGVKGKAVLDKLRKVAGREAECLPIKPWELPQFAANEARRAGGRMDSRTAAVLVDAVGADLRTLAAAVRQLLDDAETDVITEAVVRRYFGGRAEVTSFAVADDVLDGRAEGALGKLRWALSTGVAPVLITSAVSSGLRSLGKYLDARDSRMRDADIARLVGVPPWKVKTLSQQARAWNPAGVAKAIQAVAVADAQIKGAASDPGFALEQVVLTVIGCRR